MESRLSQRQRPPAVDDPIGPRQSRPFDLAVRWEYKPSASQAMIEVQEPKLALQLEGPRKVLYGKKQLYRLKLANTGNGNAENVAITIIPVGAGENMPASHKVGLLTAGEEKILDVELTARQAGDLTIQADARGDGNLHAALVEKVLVRRAGLKVDVDGPKVQYVGAVAAYAVRIRNPGTAPAHNVSLSMAIPAGAKYLSGIEGAGRCGRRQSRVDRGCNRPRRRAKLRVEMPSGRRRHEPRAPERHGRRRLGHVRRKRSCKSKPSPT